MLFIMSKVLEFLFNNPIKLVIAGNPWLHFPQKLPIFWFFYQAMRKFPPFFFGKAPDYPHKAAQCIDFYRMRQRWLLESRTLAKFPKFWVIRYWTRLSHFFETCLDLFSLDHFLGDRTRQQGLQIVIILKINQKHPLADRAVELNRFIANRLTLKDKWLFFLILLLFHAAQAFIWLD